MIPDMSKIILNDIKKVYFVSQLKTFTESLGVFTEVISAYYILVSFLCHETSHKACSLSPHDRPKYLYTNKNTSVILLIKIYA